MGVEGILNQKSSMPRRKSKILPNPLLGSYKLVKETVIRLRLKTWLSKASLRKSMCLECLTSETIEQIPNLTPTKKGKLDYKSFEKIVMAAIIHSKW